MKKGIVLKSLIVGTALLLTNCGDKNETAKEEVPVKKEMDMCSCFEKQQEMNAELEAAGNDEKMLEAIESKFKEDREACEKLGEKMQEEMKDLSEEEIMSKFLQMSEDCPAMKNALGGF